MKLTELKVNEKGTIVKISLPDKFKKRLFELGFYNGARIMVTKTRKKVFIIISVKESHYALRYKDAEFIEVIR